MTSRSANTLEPPENAKEIYRAFSATEATLPIFSRSWWLDAVAGEDGWDVAVICKGNEVVAAMPYAVRRRYGMTTLGQPPLTQKLGPWLRSYDSRPATRLAQEKEWMQGLIDQLPAFDHFSQNWHYGQTNWLPFSWNGFRQTTRYTYVLHDLSSHDTLWSGFEHSARAECKKATERFRLQVRDDLPLEAMIDLNRQTFERQGLDVPFSEALVRRIDAACAQRGCRKFFIAVDAEGRHHAANYIVWDETSSYGLMSGANPALRNSGGASLCMWEAIRHASKVTRKFDFAGSMMEPVERFLRSFGATQMPYSNVSKTPSKLLRMRQFLQSARAERYHRKSAA
ncbi:MAG TPA: GNAT family N-acetyltransferase [Paucimonas sp.]|nr:GNAT family N-acetyltransferase [Paucimonas sp.]